MAGGHVAGDFEAIFGLGQLVRLPVVLLPLEAQTLLILVVHPVKHGLFLLQLLLLVDPNSQPVGVEIVAVGN